MGRTTFPVADKAGAQQDIVGYADGSGYITPATVVEDSAHNEPLGKTSDSAYAGSGSAGIIGILKGIYAKVVAGLPASLGQKTKANSTSVTLASDDDHFQVEDAVHGSGDKGAMMLAVRRDGSPVSGTNADGDYATVNVDYYGRVWTNADAVLGLTGAGEQAKAASLPVVPASDWDLPDTAAGDLAAIAAPMPASAGQKAKAASFPVTLASDEDDLGISTGATDDGAAAGQIFPMAGLYDDTATDEVDEGDVGRMRMSARRAILNTPDFILTEVDAADLNAGSVMVDGITFESLYSLKMGSEDGATYGASAVIVIPMGVRHWRSLWLAIKNGATAHDQNIAVTVYASPQNSTSLNNPRARVAQFTIPTTANLALVVGEGTVGQGGQAGAATAVNLALYALTIPRGTPYVQILLSATTPTTGAFASIEISRMA